MTDVARSVVERSADDLAGIVEEFEEELGKSPRLGELLEIIEQSVPSTDAMAGVVSPMELAAILVGGKRYRDRRNSRVGELNDVVFGHATEFLVSVGDDLREAGEAVSTDALIARVAVAIQHADCVLADVRCVDVAALAVIGSKTPTAARAMAGDVVAIPAVRGGFHFASFITRNRFGAAFGIWRGVRSEPLLASSDMPAALRVLYSDERAIKDGSWPILGNSPQALGLFPDEPELYHRASSDSDSDVDGAPGNGEFGAAEKSNGQLRDVSREEAVRIGLLDGTHEQTYFSDFLPQALAAES